MKTNIIAAPFLIQPYTKKPSGNTLKGNSWLPKRISPFFLLAIFFLFLFPYMFITGTGNIENIYVKIILFPFLFANVLFADFVIWNYFERKNIVRIWVIELCVSGLLIYLLV
ncbi:MAG: hypothetical protein ABJA79_02180 [Parafilimonas sp.]